MRTRLPFLGLVFFSATALAAADEAFVLTPKEKSKSEGYWVTDQGYWVSCGLRKRDLDRKIDDSDPGVLIFRLGLMQGGRLHPGPFGVDGQDLKIIGPAWLVIRERDAVILRVPLKMEFDPGNEIHLAAELNAEAEIVPKLRSNSKSGLNPEAEEFASP